MALSYKQNQVSLRSSLANSAESVETEEINVEKFLYAGSICAIVADSNSFDTLQLVRIIEEFTAQEETSTDSYGLLLKAGESCLKANFLEKNKETKPHHIYKISTKVAFVFKECGVPICTMC